LGIVANRVHRAQFHPGYGYEDFVRGLQLGEKGETEYRDGVLLRVVTDLDTETADLRKIPFVLILDELNRADLSRVLGECFSLMEDRDTKVRLAGHDATPRLVQLPENLHFIGTMNLIDQSLEHVDFALRRRFFWVFRGFTVEDFLELSKARWEALRKANKVKATWEKAAPEFSTLAERARRLNEEIDTNSYLGQQYQIGHTYFCDVVALVVLYLAASDTKRQRVLFNGNGGALQPVVTLWKYAIEPLLSQYLSGIDAAERTRILAQFEQILVAPK
jgi:5-methylcytosine-specific restriction protein B